MDITRSEQSSGVRMSRHVRTVGVVLLLVGSLVAGSAAVASAQSEVAEINVTTSYDGLAGDGQAVHVTFRVTAKTQISGLRIEITPTRQSLVDFGSIEPQPQGEGVSATNPSPGVYRVDQLEAGQGILLEFDAYPRRLDREQLAVANVQVSAENPSTYETKETVRANMSSSPLLQYRQAESKLNQFQLFETGILVGIVVALFVGIAGLAAAGYYRFRALPNARDAKDEEFVKALKDKKSAMPSNQARQEIEDLIDEYEGSDVLDDIPSDI